MQVNGKMEQVTSTSTEPSYHMKTPLKKETGNVGEKRKKRIKKQEQVRYRGGNL